MTPWRAITRKARQPRKKRRPLFTCGACGKSHSSLLGHTCKGGGDFGRRRKAAAREAAAAKKKQEAAARRAAENARVAAVRRRERAKSRDRVAAARAAERAKRKPSGPRPRADRHDWSRCRDTGCERPACQAYRAGREDEAEASREQS